MTQATHRPSTYSRATLSFAAFVLLIALAIFSIGLNRSAVPACRVFTVAETVEQAFPSPVLELWQKVMGAGIVQGRSLSLLLMALTLACLYRLVNDLGKQYGGQPAKQSVWAVLLASLISIPLAFLGWTVLDGGLCFIVTLSLLLLWRITTTKRQPGWVMGLFALVMLSLLLWSMWWLLMLIYGVYTLFFSNKRNHQSTGIFLLFYGLVGFLIWFVHTTFDSQAISDLLWHEIYTALKVQVPVLVVFLWGAGLAGLLAWYRDRHSKRRPLTVLLGSVMLVPVVNIVSGSGWSFITPAIFAAPLAMCFSFIFVTLSFRSQVLTLIISAMLLLAPRSVDDIVYLQNELQAHYKPGTALVVNLSTDYDQSTQVTNVAGQLCTPAPSPIYYIINKQLFAVDSLSGAVTALPMSAIQKTPAYFVLSTGAQKDLDIPGKRFIYAAKIKRLSLELFAKVD
ncbi:MAG: hypothetical protein ABI947_28165 [Chloroflexota bacterium]